MEYNINVKKIDIPSGQRILVTSDIHGHIEHLKGVLAMASFSDNDLLIIVGDIIEKGPNSLGTVRYIMELCEKGNVIVLAGNVDTWRMQMMDNISIGGEADFLDYLEYMRNWKGTSLFDEMTQELGFTVSSTNELVSNIKKIETTFKAELDFIRGLPTILETKNYIFVHSGLPEDGLNSIKEKNIYDVLGRRAFMNEDSHFSKNIVVGHWPVSLYSNKYSQNNPIINSDKKIISIDGGCGLKSDGQLNLLIIPNIACKTHDITHVYYDTYPLAVAVENQCESTDSIKIGYLDNDIEPLETDGDFTYARHISTGRCLWIHNDDLRNGRTKCDDCSDYRLPVTAGDKVSLVRETSRGFIIKKNGISGWYYGKLKKLSSVSHSICH